MCISAYSKVMINFGTLISKQVVDSNRCWVFWLVGFHLGFLNENLFSSEEACRDIYIFINILTTERPTMRLRVHSFCKVVVRCEISTLVLSIKTNREELNCRYAKLMYFGFLELKNSVNGKLIRKKKRVFKIEQILQKDN